MDNDFTFQMDLADKYSVNEDQKVYTFSLKENILFSDGEKLDAKDVEFTFNQAKEKSTQLDLSYIKEVKAVDNLTVEFTLTHPHNSFLFDVSCQGIVPEHAYDENYGKKPIGTGPFKLVEWKKGEQLIVERNDQYFKEKPYFKRVTFAFMSEETAFANAKKGDMDFIGTTQALAKNEVPGMKLHASKTADYYYIGLPNVKEGVITREDGVKVGNNVTSDKAMRQAISYAVNRENIVKEVLDGYGNEAFSENEGLPWSNPEAKIEDGDMEKAKQLLDDAGWKMNEKTGIREKDGVPAAFTLGYPSVVSTRQALSLYLAKELKNIGIEITVKGYSWEDMTKKYHSEGILFGGGKIDPSQSHILYGSDQAGIGNNNTGYYKNEAVDHYFDLAEKETSVEKSYEYWKAASWDGETGTSTKGDCVNIWLANLDHLYFINEDLDIGEEMLHTHSPQWPVFANLEEWKWK